MKILTASIWNPRKKRGDYYTVKLKVWKTTIKTDNRKKSTISRPAYVQILRRQICFLRSLAKRENITQSNWRFEKHATKTDNRKKLNLQFPALYVQTLRRQICFLRSLINPSHQGEFRVNLGKTV